MGNKKMTTIVLILSIFFITIFPFKGSATTREGEYTYRENPIQNNGFQYVYWGLGSVAILVLGFIIYSRTRKNV